MKRVGKWTRTREQRVHVQWRTQRTGVHREQENRETAKNQRTESTVENTENGSTQRTGVHREQENAENWRTENTQSLRGM